MICIYFSSCRGRGEGVSAFHDLRSAIWMYFSCGKGVCVGVSAIHDLALYLLQWGKEGMVKGICYSNLRSAICIYFNGIGVSIIHNLQSLICIYFSGVMGV